MVTDLAYPLRPKAPYSTISVCPHLLLRELLYDGGQPPQPARLRRLQERVNQPFRK